MADIEKLTPRYVLRDHIATLDATHAPRWQQTQDRATEALALLNGDKKAPIASGFAEIGVDVEAFRVDLPDKYLVAYHQKNLIAKDKPRVKRWARGDSIPAKTEATKIEQIMQAAMDDKQRGYPWHDSVDVILNQGVALSITLPHTADMRQDFSLYEYDRDGTPTKQIKPRYERDKDGKSREEAGEGFRVSPKASAKARDEEQRDYRARRIPVTMQVLGPTEFIPVFGPGLVLDAVLVKRKWTLTEIMKARWVWDGMEEHLSPDGTEGSGSGQIDVYELYALEWMDDGAHPYVAYAVEGKKTATKNEDGLLADAVIDLRETCGLERLPCILKWGPHWANPNPDKRAMPFVLPFAQSWLAIDAILTGATVSMWWSGFPTLIEETIPGAVPDYSVEDDQPDDVEIAPLSVIRPAAGTKLVPLKMDVSQDVYRVVEILRSSNQDQGPPDAASGGGGQSGFQASLARAFADDAMEDTKRGVLELFAETASIAFEILTGLAERYGAIPIQRITPVTLTDKRGDGPKRQVMDLTADLAGGLYDLDADFPPQPNLAKGQQWAEWSQIGLVLREEFRSEIIGDPNPEVFEAKLLAQRIRDLPGNQAQIAALAAQLTGDDDERQRMLALAKQEATQAGDGTVFPNSVMTPPQMAGGDPNALPPGAPAMPGGPGQLGAAQITGSGGGPNIAASALGGAVGGVSGAVTRAAAAGGAIPPQLAMVG